MGLKLPTGGTNQSPKRHRVSTMILPMGQSKAMRRGYLDRDLRDKCTYLTWKVHSKLGA